MVYRQLYADQTAALDVANVDDNVDVRRPRLEFSLPSDERRQRHDQQEWTVDVIDVHQNREERNDLDGLAKSHLVRQDHTVLSTHTVHSHPAISQQYTNCRNHQHP